MMLLAEHGRWDEILFRLNHHHHRAAESGSSASRLGDLYITRPDEAAFPLHAVLRYRPPPAVVDALVRSLQHDCSTLAPGVLVPEEARETTLQQTPLHVAVASDCSLSVVERLLQGDSLVIPAMSKDGLHRFPLHWACAPSVPRHHHHKSKARRMWGWQRRGRADAEYRYDLIHYLLEQYPVAVVIPDVYQQTPLDYARHHKLPRSVLELLEEVAEEFERYSPRYKEDSPREHTEVTSMVSDSDHFNTVPDILIESPERTPLAALWGGDDDVSSLGGDFSQFSVDRLGIKTTTCAMAQVTSLFSSALSLGNTLNSAVVRPDEKPAPAPSTTTGGITFHPADGGSGHRADVPAPTSAAASTDMALYRAEDAPTNLARRHAGTTASTVPRSAPFVTQTPLSTHEEEMEEEDGEEIFISKDGTDTVHSATVRTKSLLKGNIIRLKNGSLPSSKSYETETGKDDPPTDAVLSPPDVKAPRMVV